MSRAVWIQLNKGNVGKLLKSEEVQAATASLAEQIKNRAGGDPGYLITTRVGRQRCNSSIAVTDEKLLRREMQNNTLIKSLRG